MDIQERIENRIQERIERRIHKKGFSIATTLLTMILSALVILAAVLTVYSMSSMRSGMEEQVLDGLRDLNIAVGAAYNSVSDEEYVINENGDLVKGDVNITQNTDLIDSFSKGSDVKITIFWGDTRVATSLKDPATGERVVGTKASDEVIDTVLNKGKDFYSKNLTLIGEKYYVYYIPLKNSNNEIVGMVFAGKPAASLNELINRKIMGTVGMSVLMLIIIAVIGVLMIFKISKGIKVAEAELTKLADGNLNVSLPERFLKSGDEIGAMAVAIENLGAILRNIIGKIKDAAEHVRAAGEEMDTATSQTSTNADDIGRAVEDISRGAISQAEEIENATGQVANMGNMIEQIAKNMDNMSNSSNEMKKQGEESVQIIKGLSEANDKTVEAIKRIGEQIRMTDESVNKIRESITLISSIADETSLLSLNASIEAARAGESGRGFAVVASEIQKLAEESNESAIQIEEIITKLSEESETSIKLMEGVQQIISEQQHKLKETRSKFEQVNSGISHAKNQTENVTEMTKTCDESRVKVVDVISNLSAISEENAASSEETNASMQELNATINILASQAKSLKELSNSLIEEVDFFKL